MGDVVKLHARASKGSAGSRGYKSGRKSCLEIPDARSTAKTRSGGTSSHCDTACAEIPSGSANPANPPTASIARLSASLRSVMVDRSSTALPESQATLHCADKAELYNVDMHIGNRIRLARKRFKPEITQIALGVALGTTDAAVSGWERGGRPDPERLPQLRRILRVTYVWLLEGNGDPPSPDDPQVRYEDMAADLEAARAPKPAKPKKPRHTG